MKRINHEVRPGGPTMAAVIVTRLTQHAPVFRLELLLFSCSPTPPGTSPVGGKGSFATVPVNGGNAPIAVVRETTIEPQGSTHNRTFAPEFW